MRRRPIAESREHQGRLMRSARPSGCLMAASIRHRDRRVNSPHAIRPKDDFAECSDRSIVLHKDKLR